jgi:hypothetical protein
VCHILHAYLPSLDFVTIVQSLATFHSNKIDRLPTPWLQGKLAPGVYLINFPEEDYSQEGIMSARLPSDTVKQVSSEYHGVSWAKHHQKWQALIRLGSTRKHLGLYEHEVEAAAAYNNAYEEAKAEVRGNWSSAMSTVLFKYHVAKHVTVCMEYHHTQYVSAHSTKTNITCDSQRGHLYSVYAPTKPIP